jgi:hypothetical protein
MMSSAINSEIQRNDFAFVYLDIDFPPIAWLVYRGIIQSPKEPAARSGELSWFLTNTIRRGLESTLRREGALEGYRVKEFPMHVSRLACVYAYPTVEMAARGESGLDKFRQENLVAIEPSQSDFASEIHDSNWISDFDALPLETAQCYWKGELTKQPLLEYLLKGRFVILGASVRARAYEVIKRRDPNSLAILELARLAAIFDSDLGRCFSWIKREGDRLIVSYSIVYSEQEGLEILDEACKRRDSDPNFEINWSDLEPLWNQELDASLDARFSRPDFTKFTYEFRVDKLATLNEWIIRSQG